MNKLSFYSGRRVLVTGHTGFKGAWLCRILTLAGAEVTGYALEPPTNPSLFALAETGKTLRSVTGDIRNAARLNAVFADARPEIVFHLAAQPLVRVGYADPVGTYETNVMGTVNVLEAVRRTDSVRSVLNVTTDKVYLNREREQGFRETDELGGLDPYASSKACSELVTRAYKSSFFASGTVAISTARAGNVIGGGDFAADRIVPDCVRAAMAGRPTELRNPDSVRPYQHVLEPLSAYLLIAQRQYENGSLADCYNVGPSEADCIRTRELAELFVGAWGEGSCWQTTGDVGPHESGLLRLDCEKLQKALGWQPRWDVRRAVEETVRWTKTWLSGGDVCAEMDREIREYWG